MDKIKRDIKQVREDINDVDYQIAELFEKRMKYAAELAEAKKEIGAPIYDKNREDEKLADITKNRSNPFIVKGLEEIFIQMMSISRKYQYHLVHQRDRYIENYFTRLVRIRLRHSRWLADGEIDVQAVRWENQSSYRFGWCFGGADGSANIRRCRAGNGSEQPPVNACNGAERRRRYRFGGCCRISVGLLRRLIDRV